MSDFFDDFEDDFNQGDFMNADDSFEDNLEENMDMDDQGAGDCESDDESAEAEKQEDDLTVDPFILGGAMGFAYEEGLRERKRRKGKRFSDDSD